jgi:hypothetical protein
MHGPFWRLDLLAAAIVVTLLLQGNLLINHRLNLKHP